MNLKCFSILLHSRVLPSCLIAQVCRALDLDPDQCVETFCFEKAQCSRIQPEKLRGSANTDFLISFNVFFILIAFNECALIYLKNSKRASKLKLDIK